MNNAVKVGGVAVAACAACCAVSLVPAVLAGSAFFAAGVAAVCTWGPALAGLAILAGGYYFLLRRKPANGRRSVVAVDEAAACKCEPVGAAEQPMGTSLPIACSLEAGDFQQRVAWIENLSTRALRGAERSGLHLRLTFAPEALDDVRELVAREQSCCEFLTFTLSHDAAGVYLRVSAPESARLAADELFDHFMPVARHARPEGLPLNRPPLTNPFCQH